MQRLAVQASCWSNPPPPARAPVSVFFGVRLKFGAFYRSACYQRAVCAASYPQFEVCPFFGMALPPGGPMI